ncbi:MAG: amidohydrolase [Alphaproteobacteria bacterium]|nr:MAG: amidohydrolase [Alphaproteobacteria bacterium]
MSAARACGCGAVDLHTHIVPENFPALAEGGDIPWPSMQHLDQCHANVMISGKQFRAVDNRCWSVAARLAAMEEMGITRQVLSPMPVLLSHGMPEKAAIQLGDHVNGTIAAMVAEAPDQFSGLGMVPLQNIDAAIRTLEKLVKVEGLAGVEIGTHIAGMVIGDPKFEPFFEAAEALSASIFVHALNPLGKERLVGPTQLSNALGFPCEVGLSAASVLTGGLIARHPNLRIAFSHGGGALAMLLPRLAHVWDISEAIRSEIPLDPREGARRLYYDTLVYDKDALGYLIRKFGSDRLILGSDFPFTIHDRNPAGRLDDLDLTAQEKSRLLHENASVFLGLT